MQRGNRPSIFAHSLEVIVAKFHHNWSRNYVATIIYCCFSGAGSQKFLIGEADLVVVTVLLGYLDLSIPVFCFLEMTDLLLMHGKALASLMLYTSNRSNASLLAKFQFTIPNF